MALVIAVFFFLSSQPISTLPRIQSTGAQDTIYTVSEVNVKPVPVAGMNAFVDKWSSKVFYPEEALRKKIQGMTFIQFVVNADGTLSDIELKSGLGYGCDEAAMKGLRETKLLWKPGIKQGKPVRVRMVMPFSFKVETR